MVQKITPAQQTKDWWEELGHTILGADADVITVNNLPARKYLKIIAILLPNGDITANFRFNNDSGANYSERLSTNGGADSTNVSQTEFGSGNSSLNQWTSYEFINLSAYEKIGVGWVNYHNGNGGTIAPQRDEIWAKWANTSVQITRVDAVNSGAGSYAAGSELVILGHD